MSSLSTTMLGAASALQAFQYALSATQNNIDNASTPGYARQRVTLQASPFDPAVGLGGGVSPGPLLDGRDQLAESDVWQQSGAQGDASAQSSALTTVQNAMPVSDGSGIPAALNQFFGNVAAWSVAPADASARQNVIAAAGSLAQSFQATAAAVAGASQSISRNIGSTVGQVNQLATQIAALNARIQAGGQKDEGMQAQLYSSLESLSGLVNISVLQESAGGVNVTLSSGAALVMGSRPYALTAGNAAASGNAVDSQAAPDVVIRASDGSTVNGQITSGTLHGLLEVRNVTIPGLIGDASQAGALNTLASSLVNQVNTIVGQGSLTTGADATGAGLFAATDPTHPTSAASTMAVNPGMTASQLPAIDQNGVPNGVALALGALANSPVESGGSASCTAYYGNTASLVGSQLKQAQSDQTMTAQTLAQAQSMRQTDSGVSLDAEATTVLQFQEGYQAVAKMVAILNTLSQTLIDMIR